MHMPRQSGQTSCRRRQASPVSNSRASQGAASSPLLCLKVPDLERSWGDRLSTRHAKSTATVRSLPPEAEPAPAEPASANRRIVRVDDQHGQPLETFRKHENSIETDDPPVTRVPDWITNSSIEQLVGRFGTAGLIAVVLFTVFVIWDRSRKLAHESGPSRLTQTPVAEPELSRIDRGSFHQPTGSPLQPEKEPLPRSPAEVAPAGAVQWPSAPPTGNHSPAAVTEPSAAAVPFGTVQPAAFESSWSQAEAHNGSSARRTEPTDRHTTPVAELPIENTTTGPLRQSAPLPAELGTDSSGGPVKPYLPRRLLPRVEDHDDTHGSR